AQGDDRLELVAGQLAHRRVHRLAPEDTVAQRVAEIPAGEDPQPGRGQQVAAQRRGGALSIGAGDSEDGLFDEPGGELDFSDHLDGARPRLGEDRKRERDAGAGHHQIDPPQRLGNHPAQLALERQVLVVGSQHLRAARAKQLRGGVAALPQAHHQGMSSGELHLSFSEASAVSARMMETIQKRTMIFGSAQPCSSKWWWMGAMRKMRRPVRLNQNTCTITETISAKKTPWMIALSTSFFVSTASTPRPPPRASDPTSPMKTLAG